MQGRERFVDSGKPVRSFAERHPANLMNPPTIDRDTESLFSESAAVTIGTLGGVIIDRDTPQTITGSACTIGAVKTKGSWFNLFETGPTLDTRHRSAVDRLVPFAGIVLNQRRCQSTAQSQCKQHAIA